LRPPCELVVRDLLPRLRAHVIKILVEEKGWSLASAARALGVSVTAASKYRRLVGIDDEFEEVLEKAARRAVRYADSPKGLIEVACELCQVLRLSGPLCRLHVRMVPSLGKCDICTHFIPRRVSSERLEVLLRLEEALKRADPLVLLMPEVRTNIAMAVSGAETLADVAAFPGRLTAVKGKLVAYSPPEFGASRHLASLLLKALKTDPSVRGITCIKAASNIVDTLKALGLSYVIAKRRGEGLIDPLFRALETARRVPDVLIDPGGYGVEPVAYVFGKDAVDAVEKAVRIVKALVEQRGSVA